MSVAANGAISFVCQTGGGGGTNLCANVPTYPNSTTQCNPATGALSITCSTGFGDADDDITNGCEVNLNTDVHNCGSVGNYSFRASRTPPSGCANGQAVIVNCNAGFADVGSVVPETVAKSICSPTRTTVARSECTGLRTSTLRPGPVWPACW